MPGRLGRLPTANGLMARLAYARARAADANAAALLKQANLTVQQIRDPQARIHSADQLRFLNLVAEELKDDLLGFHLAQQPDLREFGLLYYVLASSDTLGEALRRGERYSGIANEGLVQKCNGGNNLDISLHYVGISRRDDRHQAEFWATAMVRVCRQLTGSRLRPRRLRLVHRRAKTPPGFAAFFGNAVEFGAPVDELKFARESGRMPVTSADPYLNKLLLRYCDEALAHRVPQRGTFRVAVENAIVPLLPHGPVRSDDIARRLGVSARTLARRLTEEGLAYRDVLQQLRRDLANRYLADPDLAISRIAWLLGYHDVAAFSHAFKRWTGKAPRELRRRI